jgi:hypothetical protein
MIIHINDNKQLKHIKEEFNLLFPYLKIEFFNKGVPGGYVKLLIANDKKTLGECRGVHNNGLLDITPEMTVSELERSFQSEYGLNVQVFRKSGTVWLETTVTDKWTLSEQNKQGESVTRHLHRQENPYQKEEPDYDN